MYMLKRIPGLRYSCSSWRGIMFCGGSTCSICSRRFALRRTMSALDRLFPALFHAASGGEGD